MNSEYFILEKSSYYEQHENKSLYERLIFFIYENGEYKGKLRFLAFLRKYIFDTYKINRTRKEYNNILKEHNYQSILKALNIEDKNGLIKLYYETSGDKFKLEDIQLRLFTTLSAKNPYPTKQKEEDRETVLLNSLYSIKYTAPKQIDQEYIMQQLEEISHYINPLLIIDKFNIVLYLFNLKLKGEINLGNELNQFIEKQLYGKYLEIDLQILISSELINSTHISSLFSLFIYKKINISQKLFEDTINKLTSQSDFKINHIGIFIETCNPKILDFSHELMSNIIRKIDTMTNLKIQDICTMFYKSRNFKINISQQQIEDIIDKINKDENITSKDIGNFFHSFRKSEITISNKSIEQILEKFISLFPNIRGQDIANLFYGFNRSTINISSKTTHKILEVLIILPDTEAKHFSSFFNGRRHSQINISKKIFSNTINKFLSYENIEAKNISTLFYGLQNSNLSITNETLDDIMDKLIDFEDIEAVHISNFFYGFKNSDEIDFHTDLTEELLNKFIELPNIHPNNILNIFKGFENSKPAISPKIIDKIILKLLNLPNISEKYIRKAFKLLKSLGYKISNETAEKAFSKIVEFQKTDFFNIMEFLECISEYNIAKMAYILDKLKNKIGEKEFFDMFFLIINKKGNLENIIMSINGEMGNLIRAALYYSKGEYEKSMIDLDLIGINCGDYIKEEKYYIQIKIFRKTKRIDKAMELISYINWNHRKFDAKIVEAYINMENRNGSTALHLFIELMEEKELQQEKSRKTRIFTGIVFNHKLNGYGDIILLRKVGHILKEILNLTTIFPAEHKYILRALKHIEELEID